jgi:hypothetical protein
MLPFRTNEIKLNIPPKVLVGSVVSESVESYWDYPNGTDDKWWILGSNPRGWRYTLEIGISEQSHGSHLTRKPFKYNGMDVKIGDWIGYNNDGACLKVVSVVSKAEASITVVVEDYQRYNTFKNSNGSATGSGASVIIFELQESGIPVIDPLPIGPGNKFQTNVGARFAHQNVRDNYELYIENNNLEKGNVVSAYNGGITTTTCETSSNMIGVVTMPGPGPDYVTIRPHSRFVDDDVSIPSGNVGDRIYLDSDGRLTLDQANSCGSIAYITVLSATPTVVTGTVNNPSFATSAFDIEINDTTVSFTGTEVLAQIGLAINNANVPGVIATAPQEENQALSSTLTLAYGTLAGYIPFAATINGVPVTFDDATYGSIRYSGQQAADPTDMKLAIEAANIPNLEVTAPGDGTLTLTELNGNAITIVNTQTDNTGAGGQGVGFAGTNSITGLQLTNSATSTFRLRLTRADGGPIDIYDNNLLFETVTGVTSGQNGRPTTAAFVYDGLREAATTVVSDIPARDALSPGTGDMAYVLNDGTGSFALYLWDGSDWRQLATEESALVDARTFEIDYSVGDATSIFLANVSVGRKVESISADISVAFDDPATSVSVGSLANPDLLFSDDMLNVSVADNYLANPEYFVEDGSGQDAQYYVTVDPQASTVGTVTVKITYV